MPSSNILLFDANKANMMADEQYNTNTQRLNGVQSGIASSQLQNKTLYQVSLVAYAIAQIMNQNGLDANDTAAVSAFVANLSGTMLQKVADLASTQEAQAGVATGKWMSPALVKTAIDTLAAKAQNILSAETKTAFGLGPTAVPDDVLAFLGQYALYWWSRQPVNAGVTLGSVVNVSCNWVDNGSDVYYSDELDYKSRAFVTLKNPQSVLITTYGATIVNQTLKGKYYYTDATANEAYRNAILFMPENGNATNGSVTNTSIPSQVVTPNVTNNGALEFVSSTNPNAYPNSGISDGYFYRALGVPLENAKGPLRVATGSYTGTGNFGAGGASSLTFDFVPKAMTIIGPWLSPGITQDGQLQVFFNFETGTYVGCYAGDKTITYSGSCAIDGNTVYWYGDSVNDQLNNSGYIYCYYALG